MKEEIAKELLKIGAVFLRPNDMFTWASGIKSPIYCDNRIILSHPETRDLVKHSLVRLILEKFPQVNLIAGVATAGIPHAALVADIMGLPMIYIRAKAKDHGRAQLIEGQLTPGSKVVIIEDLISTGSSSLSAIQALTDQPVEILGLAAIFSYNLPEAENNFKQAGITYHTLSNYNALIEASWEEGSVTQEDLVILKNWRDSF